MIVIRNVFRLKFGKAREAVALMKEARAIEKRVMSGVEYSSRVLTDVTGPFYTLVLELTLANLATFESNGPRLFGDKEAPQKDLYNLGDFGTLQPWSARRDSASGWRRCCRT